MYFIYFFKVNLALGMMAENKVKPYCNCVWTFRLLFFSLEYYSWSNGC